ncbi:MAG: hypothetical protein AAF235_11710 [Planctomycetota bacterium]
MLPPTVAIQPEEAELFRETQRFYRNELLRVLVPVECVTVTGLMGALSTQVPPDQQLPYWLTWFGCAVLLPGAVMLMGFTTVVTDRRIVLRWFPGVFPGRDIALGEVIAADAVKYSPMGDAGGWGWRSSKKFHRVMNVCGERGVHLKYGERRKDQILIGSLRADELNAAVRADLDR